MESRDWLRPAGRAEICEVDVHVFGVVVAVTTLSAVDILF